MKRIFLAIAMLFTLSTTAMAEGLYAAIDLGKVSYSNATSTVSNAAPPKPGTIRIGGGYHFSPNLSVEAGYSIIENSTVDTNFAGVGTVSETLKASSFQVAAIGTYPISNLFDVFGKLGMANTKLDFTRTSNISTVAFSDSGSKTNLMFGLGGQYNINHHFGIRAQYEDFGKVQFSKAGGPNVGVKVISVGGVYNF